MADDDRNQSIQDDLDDAQNRAQELNAQEEQRKQESHQRHKEQAKKAANRAKQKRRLKRLQANGSKAGVSTGSSAINPIKKAKSKLVPFATNAKKKVKKLGGKVGSKGLKQLVKAVKPVFKMILSLIGKFILGLLHTFGIWLLVCFAIVALASWFAGLITDVEFSRTNTANYQHMTVVDGNTVMRNSVSTEGNIKFNPATKQYELAASKLPTKANRLYFIYYAVMAQQSRWYVTYQRNYLVNAKTNKREMVLPGNKYLVDNKQYKAGSNQAPYLKPIKFNGDETQYTMDGKLFNANEIGNLTLENLATKQTAKSEADLFTDDTLSAVKKMSLDVNMLYLLDSTLHGQFLGTGKGQMFFAEQFVKPVYHDKYYNYKSLTKVKDYSPNKDGSFSDDDDMTATQKRAYYNHYAAAAHEDKPIKGTTVDKNGNSKNERAFIKKYTAWTKLLDTQNKARGGTNPTSDSEESDAGSAAGISNPILAKAIAWGVSQCGKGITYVMGARGPNSYDCSGFVTTALSKAGMQGVITNTVGMLQMSNALGQHGTKYKQVSLKSAKKGTIIVCGGLSGGGAAGHTFFLMEDYHGGSTKVLQCSTGQGITKDGSFADASINGTIVALEPREGSDKASKDKADTNEDTTAGADLSMATPSKYKDTFSTGILTAKSRDYTEEYHPSQVAKLYQMQTINKRVWREGDFYVDISPSSKIDWRKITKATRNSEFTVGAGAVLAKKGNAKIDNSVDTSILGRYNDERGAIIDWSVKNNYNPALIIALIAGLTDDGTTNPDGSPYNFLNDPDVVKSDDDASKKKDNKKDNNKKKKPSTKKASDKKDDKKKDDKKKKDDDLADVSSAEKNYGAQYYKYKITVKTIEDGLNNLMTAMKGKKGSDNIKRVITTSRQRKTFNKAYKRLAGGKVWYTFSSDNPTKGKHWLYTYAGTSPSDPKGLGNIAGVSDENSKSVDPNKPNKTTVGIYKQRFYYSKLAKVKMPPATLADSDGSPKTVDKSAPYAIVRTKKNDITSKPKMVTGIWDYGFGTIFKIANLSSRAYHIKINKDGSYQLVSGNNIITQLMDSLKTPEYQKYMLLGITTPFGTINLGNKAIEDQNEINAVLDKLSPNYGVKLSDKDVAILKDHQLSTTTALSFGVPRSDLLVGNKPKVENTDVKLSDMTGVSYIRDYVSNYATYVPSSIGTNIDVVDRYKQMNNANETDQTAANNIAYIFAQLLSGKDGSDADGGSGASSMGENVDKQAKIIYKKLIEHGWGTLCAVAMITNWIAEDNLDPTAANGIFSTPYHINEAKKNIADNTTKAIGIAQWTEDRHKQLMAYAKKHGKNWWDLDIQLDYMSKEEPKNPQIAAVFKKMLKDPDVYSINHGYYMAYEIHGGNVAMYSAPFNIDKYTDGNDPEKHTDKAVIKKLMKELAGGKIVPPDMSKFKFGGTSGDDTSSVAGPDANTINYNGWGRGTGLNGLINKFILNLYHGVLNMFGNENYDPTMFSTRDIYNSTKARNSSPLPYQNAKGQIYLDGQLIVNGADAYSWHYYPNKLSQANTEMLVRQIVAELETRDARPVYYTDIYDRFTDYDLDRIVEERYKAQLLKAFKGADDDKSKDANDTTQADISTSPIKGIKLKDLKVHHNFGWLKGDKVNPITLFTGVKGKEVDAVKAGKVVFVGDTKYGKTVIIRTDGNTEQIAYMGLGDTNVAVDQHLDIGNKIGKVSGDDKFALAGISSDCDASKGLPKAPKSMSNPGNSSYFNILDLMNMSNGEINDITKKTNGYDPAKVKPGSKPSSYGDTEDATLGDYFPQ